MRHLLPAILVCTLGSSLFIQKSYAQSQCPPCYSNRERMNGQGTAGSLPSKSNCQCSTADCPGCPGDNRRVIRIRFDTTQSTTWAISTYPNGTPEIHPAVQRAVECSMSKWHQQRGADGNGIPYFFIIDQTATNAEIIITKESPPTGGFASISRNSTPPYTLRLSPDILNFPDSENCGRVGHELGHAMNAGGSGGCAPSIMGGVHPWYSILAGYRYYNDVYSRDVDAVQRNYFSRSICTSDYHTDVGEQVDYCYDDDGDGMTTCDGDCDDTNPTIQTCPRCAKQQCDIGWHWDWDNCACQYGEYTPILIDLEDDGFSLTDAANGVAFDFSGDGRRLRTSWTSAESDDAWLVLDRNANDLIDDGRELFGNFTFQPPSDEPNGFIALAEFDRLENGGNGDGLIDSRDSIFTALRLWRDDDHNGVSEPDELQPLWVKGIESLSLHYRESRRRDRHGNVLRYRAKVYGANGSGLGRWAYDVYLVAMP